MTYRGTVIFSSWFSLPLLVLFLVFSSAGCDDTESYKGVTFKPATANSEPFETTVFALVVKRLPPGFYDSKSKGDNLNSIIGSKWIPVNDVTILFDGKRKFVPTTRGMYSLTSVSGGNHTLAITNSDAPDRRTFLQAPLVVTRGKMTIILIDASDDNLTAGRTLVDSKKACNYRVCYKSVDHDFILKTGFKKLSHNYLSISSLVSDYQKLIGGALSHDQWQTVFHKDCRDEEGQVSDRLMALKYRQATGQDSVWFTSSWVSALTDEYTAVVLVRGNAKDGSVKGFERFSIGRSKPGETLKSEPKWKIYSIGRDL